MYCIVLYDVKVSHCIVTSACSGSEGGATEGKYVFLTSSVSTAQYNNIIRHSYMYLELLVLGFIAIIFC